MTSDLIDQLGARTLSIDCPRVTVRKRGAAPDAAYEGCGTISVSPEGELKIKAFVNPPPGSTIADRFNAMFGRLTGSVAGEVITEDEYFDLVATSLSGETWVCEKFLPRFNAGLATGGMVMYGKMWRIRSERGEVNKGEESVKLYCGAKYDFPTNGTTNTETTVAGRREGGSISWNVASFSANGLDFCIKTEGAGTEVSATPVSGKLPDHVEMRISEALSFIFDAEVVPYAIVRRSPISKTTSLYSRLGKVHAGAYPPLQGCRNEQESSFWRLFDCYLRHISRHQASRWHPLSGHLISVIRATEGSLDAQALTLVVAVEGVLKCAFPQVGRPSSDEIEQAELAFKVINESQLSERFKERVRGLISGTKSAQPKGKLYALAEMGVVRAELIPIWNKLRNTHAHADIGDPEEIEKQYQSCLAVRTLINELIFGAIGYCGEYTDYSAIEWPVRIK